MTATILPFPTFPIAAIAAYWAGSMPATKEVEAALRRLAEMAPADRCRIVERILETTGE